MAFATSHHPRHETWNGQPSHVIHHAVAVVLIFTPWMTTLKVHTMAIILHEKKKKENAIKRCLPLWRYHKRERHIYMHSIWKWILNLIWTDHILPFSFFTNLNRPWTRRCPPYASNGREISRRKIDVHSQSVDRPFNVVWPRHHRDYYSNPIEWNIGIHNAFTIPDIFFSFVCFLVMHFLMWIRPLCVAAGPQQRERERERTDRHTNTHSLPLQ